MTTKLTCLNTGYYTTNDAFIANDAWFIIITNLGTYTIRRSVFPIIITRYVSTNYTTYVYANYTYTTPLHNLSEYACAVKMKRVCRWQLCQCSR